MVKRHGAIGWLILLTSTLPAQTGATLRVAGATGTFATALADGDRCLGTTTPTSSEDRAFTVLGRLRLGHLDAARDLLDASPHDADRTAACWATISHLWYLRASRDAALVRTDVPRLHASLRAATETPETCRTFAEAALLPHALFCLGDLLHSCSDGERDDGLGAATTRRAVDLWLELERQAWQPGRGHFRPRPTRGEILLPEPPDATVLAPAAAGMLIATGDRLQQHVRASLRDLLRRPAADVRAATCLLAGAAQLGDRALLDAAWHAVATCDLDTASGGDAGRCLDATLFAVTGLRLATGAGVDAGCVRLRPHLPPGHDHVILQGLVADGARFDLDLASRSGELRHDERDEATALGNHLGPRLRVTATLVDAVDASARSIVLQGDNLQYVARLAFGDHLTRSLPIGPP